MLDLYEVSLGAIFVCGAALVLLSCEIGYRLGERKAGTGDESASTVASAVLGLLALIIGFTFAMSLSRFEARRDAVLAEANAIGTTALRARMLPEPHRAETIKLLREYTKLHLDMAQSTATRKELLVALDRSNAIQESLWQHAMALAAKDNAMVPTGIFIQTLNDMIDNQSKRLAALRNRVPNIVQLSLFALAIVAGVFSAYASGVDQRRTRLPVFAMALLICLVIMMILDLDRPNAGFIGVSQQPMIDTLSSIDSFPR